MVNVCWHIGFSILGILEIKLEKEISNRGRPVNISSFLSTVRTSYTLGYTANISNCFKYKKIRQSSMLLFHIVAIDNDMPIIMFVNFSITFLRTSLL